MRSLTALGVACWLSCALGRPGERARAPAAPEVSAPAPGLTLSIARHAAGDTHDPGRTPPAWPAATYIDHRFHVEPEPGARFVRLTEDDFLDPSPRGVQVFLVRPDGREEQLATLDPPAIPADPEAVETAKARVELPPDAGPRPLLRLLYQSDALHWDATFYIAPADSGPAAAPGAFLLRVRGWFAIINNTGRVLPEARVRLYDSPDRALRTEPAHASQAAFAVPVYEARLALGTRSETIERPTHEQPIPGRIEHVVRLADTSAPRVTRELPLEVRRELVLAPPPGHALRRAVPGMARIALREGRAPFDRLGETFFLQAEPSGSWRARMGVSPHVRATARVSVQRTPEGTYARYRLAVSDREPGPESAPDGVRVVAAIADAGMAELLSVEPLPVARDDRGLTFQLELAAPDRQARVEYLLFYPH